MTVEFEKWPSIARLKRDMVITEKLDGTNAQVTIVPLDDKIGFAQENPTARFVMHDGDWFAVFAGSRKRWLGDTKENDNFGFGRWVTENAADLVLLGEGSHYGEWWGQGIQRGYDLGEKRFSLFNTGRWNDENTPDCVHVVPQLYAGPFSTASVDGVMIELKKKGSLASPGFMNPEGVIVYHTHANSYFKMTFEHDSTGKPFGA